MKKLFNKDNRFITSIFLVLLLFSLRQSFYLFNIYDIRYSNISFYYPLHFLLLIALIPIVIFTLYYLPVIFVLKFRFSINLRMNIRIELNLPFTSFIKQQIIIQKNRYKLIQVFRF